MNFSLLTVVGTSEKSESVHQILGSLEKSKFIKYWGALKSPRSGGAWEGFASQRPVDAQGEAETGPDEDTWTPHPSN